MMLEYRDRYKDPKTGEWKDGKRECSHFIFNEEARDYIDDLTEKLRNEAAATETRMKLWIVCSIAGAVFTIALAFALPLADKIYGQAAVDTAQTERIDSNQKAIARMREHSSQEHSEEVARSAREFDRLYKRLDRLESLLEKVLEHSSQEGSKEFTP